MIGWIKRTFIPCSMMKFFVRQGMLVEKFQEIFSYQQSMCLKKFRSFNNQKNQTKNDFEKTSKSY